jgi:type IV pilus assembly protein PilA
MFQRFHAMKEEREGGFTLIELLVVILIIAILAAIAIPVFLNQRKKGWTSQSQSALKNAATAMETCGTETNGAYNAAACGGGVVTETVLASFGFSDTATVTITGTATATAYCLTATHTLNPDTGATGWAVGTYGSSTGTPTPADACTPATG